MFDVSEALSDEQSCMFGYSNRTCYNHSSVDLLSPGISSATRAMSKDNRSDSNSKDSSKEGTTLSKIGANIKHMMSQ